jgi:FkbM family methyltransferase
MHSQYGEEAAVLSLFEHHDPNNSRFLDVGAYDGITFSNTYGLVEKGWGGVYVEPNAHGFDALVATVRKLSEAQRARMLLVNAALDVHPGVKPWWYTKNMVSTSDDAVYQIWKAASDYTQVYIPHLSVADFLDQFPGPYNFINLDAEGASFNLLKALPIAALRPEAICIEYDANYVGIWELLAVQHNYRQVFLNQLNVIFAL